MVHYDKNGICTTCGMPGSGFVSDGVCHCLDEHPVGCTCKECSDLWEEIEAEREYGDVSRDMSHARNYNV